MSQCLVPSWNERHQRQGRDHQGKEGNKPSSLADLDYNNHHHHQSFPQVVPMSNYEITELTWENGQLGMQELGGMFPPPSTSTSPSPAKPTWAGSGRVGDTLESIVHQATYCNKESPNVMPEAQQAGPNIKRVESFVESSGGKWAENSGPMQTPGPPPHPGLMKKRKHSESERWGRNNLSTSLQPNDHESTCASANAASCKDNNDTTMMTWPSFESPRSCTRTKTTTDDDSTCHVGSENQEEERETKEETGRSYTIRKGRAAVVHNQSERKRRERINQKMKTLQKLVPNASKTDKASMLDEVIEYLKQLQAQVKMMSNARFMPQIMMPLGMQQHLHQMSLLARMGMGMGMGMGTGLGMGMGMGMLDTTPQPIPQLIHPTQVASATSAFVPPAFVVPQMIPTNQQPNPDPASGSSATLQDPYSTLLAQSMNIDLYNRMAALQRQQQTQPQPTSNHMQFNNHVQGG